MVYLEVGGRIRKMYLGVSSDNLEGLLDLVSSGTTADIQEVRRRTSVELSVGI